MVVVAVPCDALGYALSRSPRRVAMYVVPCYSAERTRTAEPPCACVKVVEVPRRAAAALHEVRQDVEGVDVLLKLHPLPSSTPGRARTSSQLASLD